MTTIIRSGAAQMRWDETYAQGGEAVPWYIGTIPTIFQDFVATQNPGRALDIGCGLGQYTDYLTKQGFETTGVDFSHEALAQARTKYVGLDFQHMDALDIADGLEGKFDLITDVSLFHHLAPADKERYALAVSQKLAPTGTFAMCCFDTADKYFVGKEAMFSDVSNTTMYPATQSIIENTFNPYFRIDSLEKITFGKEYDKKRFFTTMRLK